MSMKGPPLTEISSTAPSKPLSRLYRCENVKVTYGQVPKNVGVSSLESVTQPGASWNAEFGAVFESRESVTQFVPAAQVAPRVQLAGPGVKDVTHPAGNAGGTTPSKLSLK